jgi:hypothetical protein
VKGYSNASKRAGESDLEKGTSFDQKCDKNYEPRTSGVGQRPEPAKGKKTGMFTIK